MEDLPCSGTLSPKLGRFKSCSDWGSPLGTQKGTIPEWRFLAPPKLPLLSVLAAVTPSPSCLKSADLVESVYTLVLPSSHAWAWPRQWWHIRNHVRKPVLPSSMGMTKWWHLSFMMLISRLSVALMLRLHHMFGTTTVLVQNFLGNSDLQLWGALS